MRTCAVLLAFAATTAFAQKTFEQNDWTKPFPAHRIVGPVYYVGTTDLAVLLIEESSKGDILIDTGLSDSGLRSGKASNRSASKSRMSRSCSRTRRISITSPRWPR